MPRGAAVLFSGGKDSTFACFKALEMGYEIKCLITIYSENPASYMLHTTNIELTELSAKAMGLPRQIWKTPGTKEEELHDIEEAVKECKREFGFQSLFTGAIASKYQKERVEAIGKRCMLDVISPLWGIDQERYLETLEGKHFSYIITSVSAHGIDDSWLGKNIGPSEVKELISLSHKYRFNTAFEGGEAETLVLDCPIFTRGRIRVLESEKVWNGYLGVLKVKKACIEEKPPESNVLGNSLFKS